MVKHPRICGMILYLGQPFPYDLARDWQVVRLGRELGWTGVALKTCKTQTGTLLSPCWVKSHGMTLIMQDLTSPMLAQIPHVLLTAHAGTIIGSAITFHPRSPMPTRDASGASGSIGLARFFPHVRRAPGDRRPQG